METTPNQTPMKWFEVWLSVIFHPTIKTFTRIINDPKVSVKLGVIWMAIAAFVAWFIGPQRATFWGWVFDNFGYQAQIYFYTVGPFLAVILGVFSLLLLAAVAQRLATLFGGKGRYKEVVYSWAVIQPPFILLTGVVVFLTSLLPGPRDLAGSKGGMIVTIITLLAVAGILLYLTYAEMVAFSTVEKFSIGRSIGICLLSLVVVNIIGIILSYIGQELIALFWGRL